MDSRCIDRRRMAVAGGAVLIVVGAFTAGCGTSGNQAPTTTDYDDNDHHHDTTTTTTERPCAHRKESQPKRGQPLHARRKGASGANRAARGSPQQVTASRIINSLIRIS